MDKGKQNIYHKVHKNLHGPTTRTIQGHPDVPQETNHTKPNDKSRRKNNKGKQHRRRDTRQRKHNEEETQETEEDTKRIGHKKLASKMGQEHRQKRQQPKTKPETRHDRTK
eukprot:11746700-Ditylum_brightwellii.AAC.1